MAIAVLVGVVHYTPSKETMISGPAAIITGVAVVIAVCAMLYRAGRIR